MQMKESILQRYEIAKWTHISQRPPIPKINNERHAKSAVETAIKVINQTNLENYLS